MQKEWVLLLAAAVILMESKHLDGVIARLQPHTDTPVIRVCGAERRSMLWPFKNLVLSVTLPFLCAHCSLKRVQAALIVAKTLQK